MGKSFGRLIRGARQRRRWDQTELAEKIGNCQQATISTWESGKSEPNDVNLKKLMEVLELRAEEIAAAQGEDAPSMPASDLMGLLKRRCNTSDFSKMRVYLLCSSSIPMIDVAESRNEVLALIRAGVKYSFIWFADLAPTEAFERTVGLLREIVAEAAIETGCSATHHLIHELLPSPAANEFKRAFDDWKMVEPRGQMFDDKLEAQLTRELRGGLRDFVSSLCPVGVYALDGAPIPAVVRISLTNLLAPDGSPFRPAFAIVPEDRAKQIYQTVLKLLEKREDSSKQTTEVPKQPRPKPARPKVLG